MSSLKENQVVLALKAVQKLSRGCSMKELAASLAMSNKSAYRYVESLRAVGFNVVDIGQYRYKIENPRKQFEFSLDFSQEEADLILRHLPPGSELLQSIRQKLILHSDLLSVPNRVLEAELGVNIKKLQEAIRNDKRVCLKGYSSANSNTQRDMVVEPIVMLDHYRRLYAVNLTDRKLVQLKTERIERVAILPEARFSLLKEEDIQVDAFWSVLEEERCRVQLRLNLSAFLIISEEYPAIRKYTAPDGDKHYLLETEVSHLRPLVSLVLRLPDAIEVLGPAEFEQAVVTEMEKHSFLKKYFLPLSQVDKVGD